MQLDHLFDATTWPTTPGAWAHGYREARSFAEGAGAVDGDRIRGSLRWSSRSNRREDGVWLVDIDGFIDTDDGAQVLVSLTGRTREDPSTRGQEGLFTGTFATSAERYRWLNDATSLLESRFSPESGLTHLRAHLCGNDFAVYSSQSAARSGE